MKKIILLLVLALCGTIGVNSQVNQQFNFDFEQNEDGFPSMWQPIMNSGAEIYTDSSVVKNGNYSLVIENEGGESNFTAISMVLPENYQGEFIRLSGFIKTENVEDGHAGLWMRIDPQIAFDNMSEAGVTGTTNWKEYEIILPLNPADTDQIVIGGLLTGKGKMWMDEIRVSVDGKDLDSPELEVYHRELLPAEMDDEFEDGSTITFPELTEELILNLELLGKVWGLLKYHHPEVAKGNYNWDYELFRLLPDYLQVKDKQERDRLLVSWIDSYGNLPACETCIPAPEDAVLKPDLSWIQEADLSPNLKARLQEVYDTRNQGTNFYISLHEGVGNPEFTNEDPYEHMPYPDEGYRLLSLYRYWNMIHYFFPNRHLTDQPWGNVLKEYLFKFINAQDELEYELVALQLIAEVSDSHANIWKGADQIYCWRGNNYAPFRGKFIEDKFIITDYYKPELKEESNLKIGDIITHINGRSINSLVDSLQPFYPASNRSAMLRDVAGDLLRSTDSTLFLDVISDGIPIQKLVPLHDAKDINMIQWYQVDMDKPSYKLLEDNIGYVTLANIKAKEIPEIKESFRNTRGIIIDIRNYPSSFVPFALGSYFVQEPSSFVKFTRGNPNNPGEFTSLEGPQIQNDENPYQGKVVVLVNEATQSQAEYTALAFRAAESTTIIGSTTAGANGNISPITLPGGLYTMISGIGVYYPDGTETQRVGIIPDVVVEPTIESIKEGKDEVLEKALEIINQH